MSQKRHKYQRIVLDDDSSNDDSDKNIDKTEQESGDENTDASIENVSHLLEGFSFKKRNTYGHRTDRTDDEVTSPDEDTYLEDSFLVKDSNPSEASSNISSGESSYESRKPPIKFSKQQTKATSERMNKQKSADYSSFFKSDLSDAGIDDKKISALLELYPELKENVDPKRGAPSGGGNIPERDTSGSDSQSDEEGDDKKLEKYVEKIKTQPSVSTTYGDRNLAGFIVSDSESIDEYSSECESSNSNGSVIVDESDNDDDNDNDDDREMNADILNDNERAAQWRFPASEKKKKRKELGNSLLGFQNTRGVHKKNQPDDDDENFLLALSPNGGPTHPDAQKYITAKFSRIRDDLMKKLFALYRKRCFENKLDPNMVLEWNTRLRKTAGRCHCDSNGTAKIVLSIKVCNTPDRLRDTLLHELCHAAVWLIDRIRNGQHGPAWKYWVYRCHEVFPSLPLIERCHRYRIDAKYLYVCDRCGQTVQRHSKSLDTERKICAICRGHFVLRTRIGEEMSTKPANIFAQFVKQNYGDVKKCGVKKHAEIMQILSQRFKEEKDTASATNEIIGTE